MNNRKHTVLFQETSWRYGSKISPRAVYPCVHAGENLTWESFEQLDTYLDGELPEEAMRTVDAHVRSCRSCSADAIARLQMKRAIQLAGKRYTVWRSY